jgi:hypothetical protein
MLTTTTTPTTTSCQSCGTELEGAMHVMLCDDCLKARLAQLERAPAPPAGWSRDRGHAQPLAAATMTALTAALADQAA